MLSTIVFALILPVQAQVSFGVGVDVQVVAPTVRFEAEPPLVLVAPGVVVVRDYESEVFFSNGFYWTAKSGHWYRTRSYRGGWSRVPRWRVPGRIARVRTGSYRHYRGGRHFRGPRGSGRRGYNRGYDRHDRRDVHRGGYRNDRRDAHRGRGRYERRDVRDHRRGERRHDSGRGDRRHDNR
jgi:hypothetical protein